MEDKKNKETQNKLRGEDYLFLRVLESHILYGQSRARSTGKRDPEHEELLLELFQDYMARRGDNAAN